MPNKNADKVAKSTAQGSNSTRERFRPKYKEKSGLSSTHSLKLHLQNETQIRADSRGGSSKQTNRLTENEDEQGMQQFDIDKIGETDMCMAPAALVQQMSPEESVVKVSNEQTPLLSVQKGKED